VAVVVLTNLSGSLRAIELSERSGNLLVDRPRSGGPKLTEAQMKAVQGAYQREGKLGPARVEVVRRKDELYLVIPGRLPFPLLPLSPTRFRIDGTPAEYLTFDLEGGSAHRARLERKDGRPLVTFLPREKPGRAKAVKGADRGPVMGVELSAGPAKK
jgi:hypothetical protein